MSKKNTERIEALMRIAVLIVTGIVLGIWKMLIVVIVVINWFITIFTDKRNKDLAEFCEIWNSQIYTFLRYMAFVSNERPFPFRPLKKNLSHFKK